MKVLGLCWNTDSDEFTFNFDELIKFANSMTLTERNVLLFGGRFYDSPWVLECIYHSESKCYFKSCVLKRHTGTVL